MLGKALIIALVVATSGARPPARPDAAAFDSEEAAARAKARRAEIAAELGDTPDHDWAGSYYEGDGLGANLVVDLAPGAGFVFEWHGCMGLYGRNYGAATEAGGRVRLEPELANEPGKFGNIEVELLPVRWGPRRYLVAAGDVTGFCNAVNGGSEPRDGVHGSFLLRRGDESKPVTGRPRTGEGELDCLLERPIRATIVSAGPRETKKDDPDWATIPVVLDVGREHGVWTGMEFRLLPPGRAYQIAKVTRVFERSSEAAFGTYGERDFQPRPGWKLATRLN
jgi:hypothetical protein